MDGVIEPTGQVVLASHNRGKIEELQRLAAGRPFRFVPAGQLELPVPDETADTYLGNAELKAKAATTATAEVSLADDTGLEIEELPGELGVRTADFAAAHGGWPGALAALDRRLGLSGGNTPAAVAICALVLAWPDGRVESAEARVEGTLRWPPQPLPGFAAIFRSVPNFERGGVLLHRRRAFDRLFGPAATSG